MSSSVPFTGLQNTATVAEPLWWVPGSSLQKYTRRGQLGSITTDSLSEIKLDPWLTSSALSFSHTLECPFEVVLKCFVTTDKELMFSVCSAVSVYLSECSVGLKKSQPDFLEAECKGVLWAERRTRYIWIDSNGQVSSAFSLSFANVVLLRIWPSLRSVLSKVPLQFIVYLKSSLAVE